MEAHDIFLVNDKNSYENSSDCIPSQHQRMISDPRLRDEDPGMHGSPSLGNSGV